MIKFKNQDLAAIHEAGHVVVASIFGVPVKSVTVSNNGKTEYKEKEEINEEENKKYEENKLMITLAGGAAAERFDKMWLFAWDDIEKAKKIIKKNANEELCDQYFGDAVRTIRKMVRKQKHRKYIKDVSLELIKRQTLTGDEVLEIMGLKNMSVENFLEKLTD